MSRVSFCRHRGQPLPPHVLLSHSQPHHNGRHVWQAQEPFWGCFAEETQCAITLRRHTLHACCQLYLASARAILGLFCGTNPISEYRNPPECRRRSPDIFINQAYCYEHPRYHNPRNGLSAVAMRT